MILMVMSDKDILLKKLKCLRIWLEYDLTAKTHLQCKPTTATKIRNILGTKTRERKKLLVELDKTIKHIEDFGVCVINKTKSSSLTKGNNLKLPDFSYYIQD